MYYICEDATAAKFSQLALSVKKSGTNEEGL